MNAKLIRWTPSAEETVCTAARNDYRSEGVLDDDSPLSFESLMESVDPSLDHVSEAANDMDIHPAQYLSVASDRMSHEEKWEHVDLDDVDSRLLNEAKKRTLLEHLMNSGHWGPFEHVSATIALEGVTRVLMAQVTRHRHFTFDVMSLRYVGVEDEFTKAPYDREEIENRFQFPVFRGDDYDVDRDGVHEITNVDLVQDTYAAAYTSAIDHYRSLLSFGVPQEQARKVLPMGTKVNIVMSGNARHWMHFLNVRTRADVQGETRRCAEACFDELEEWMPFSFGKFRDMVPTGRLAP